MVDYEYADLFLENDVQKNFIITDGVVSVAGGSFVYGDYTYLLTNDDLKSVPRITELLTDEKDLDFGACNSGFIEFSIAANVTSLIGKTCRVYVWMDNRKETLFRIGKYKVTSDKATADRNYRDVVAYDKLQEIKKTDVTAWYKAQFPTDQSKTTIRAFRSSFFRYFGIDDVTDTTDMVNDLYEFGKTIGDGSVIDGETIMYALCQANAGFGHIDRNGDFKCICLVQGLIGLYPAIDLYPAEDLYPRKDNTTLIDTAYYIPPLAYEDYYTTDVSQVRIAESDDDAGVVVGEEGNAFNLVGNFIFFGASAQELETAATNILERLNGVSYMPFNVRAFGNPCYEVGDAVRLRTGNVRVNSYILKRVLTGTTAMEDQYESVGNQVREEISNDLSVSIQKLKSKTAKIEKSVDQVSVELTEQLDDTIVGSYAYVTSQEIGTKVSNGTFTSTVQQLNNSISFKVSYGDVSSSLSLESGQVTLNSNRLVVNSTNFTLAPNGNATFSGVVEAATISGGDILGTDIVSSGSDSWAELYNGLLLVKPSMSSSEMVRISTSYNASASGYVPSVEVLTSQGNTIIQGGYVTVGASVKLYGNDITISGVSVLTANSDISASKVTGRLSSSNLPTDAVCAGDDVNRLEFGKTFEANGRSGSYEMKLQTVTIGSDSYVIYACKN